MASWKSIVFLIVYIHQSEDMMVVVCRYVYGIVPFSMTIIMILLYKFSLFGHYAKRHYVISQHVTSRKYKTYPKLTCLSF